MPDADQDPILQKYRALQHIVCLGASAGGLEALEDFFHELPPDLGLAYVVVVHLSPDFKSLMAQLLAKHTSMPVHPAEDGMPIEANSVYIIPPGKNMIAESGRLRLQPQDRSPGHGINLPIDLFLSSLAKDAAQRSIAVVLSGTGSDGSRGVRRIKEAGGIVLAQLPKSAKFDGMPISALGTGLVDQVGLPAQLANRITELSKRNWPAPDEVGDDDEPPEEIAQVLGLIRANTSIDMSYLRPRMVGRRLRRRMAINGIWAIKEYLAKLERDPEELAHLADDLLIVVTSFFRDAHAFDSLQRKIIPKYVLEGRDPSEPIRVWVAACATGQEVYSIAMILLQALAERKQARPLKIFATDVNEFALTRASRGHYSLSEAADIPPRLLTLYMDQAGNQYTVRNEVRSTVLFARHNLVEDPPFTKMDLVCCRNLLIYLTPEAQKRALATLTMALKPETGLLFLGSAESASVLDSGLQVIDARSKIYRRHGTLPTDVIIQPAIAEPTAVNRPDISAWTRPAETRTQQQLELLRSIVDCSLQTQRRSVALTSPDGRLVEVFSDPLAVFRLPRGKPTDHLARLLPRDLVSSVATGWQRLTKGEPTVHFVVPTRQVQGATAVQIQMFALEKNPSREALHLLTIDRRAGDDDHPAPPVDLSSAEQVESLQQELAQTRESLQATIEELQASNEEQQSTNEELVASNEELQSTNEELHSVNEELFTVNAEYQKKNQELQVLSADLDNLLRNINVGTLYLDDQLRIRRFTPTISRIIPLQESDIGRPMTELVHRLEVDLSGIASEVLNSDASVEMEVRDRFGSWLLMRIVPHRTMAGADRGLLITFVDITKVKNAEETSRVVSSELAAANSQLAEQSEQLEDLFSIVAHDLKRPVLGVDGVLTLAHKKLQRGETDQALRHVQAALEATSTLRTILQDLGDMAQLTHFEPVEEEVDLMQWLESLLEPFAGQSKDRAVQFHWVSDSGTALFCRAAAQTILSNLVENALLHGTSGRRPRVDVICSIEPAFLRIVVMDNGRGIAPENHERVFELFRRLTPNETPGTGVGLVAARRMAQRANGTLRLESSLGHGAKFTVELPARRTAEARTKHPARVLLVEDDDLDAKAATMALEGYSIERARTLTAARELARTGHFDVVLLDLSLPDGHGLSLVSDLRADGQNRVPVVILSGHADGLIREALQVSSVVGAISKDSTMAPEFREVVQNALRGRNTS